MYVTGVVPFGKLSPGLYVLTMVTPPQLSVAVGAVQLTGIEHPEESEAAMLAGGHAEITGGIASMPEDWQHNVPPFLLSPSTIVKSPNVDPIKMGVAHDVLMDAFRIPSILKFSMLPANLSSGNEPVIVNVLPAGTTNVPISPLPSWAVTTAGKRNPLYRKVNVVTPP